jgi:hypothetical protein
MNKRPQAIRNFNLLDSTNPSQLSALQGLKINECKSAEAVVE